MHAADIMTRTVITATPKTEVREIVDLMMQNRISAVPVVDDAGRVIGMVSEGDLMRRVENDTDRRDSWWLSALFSARNDVDAYVKSRGRRAEDIMTRDPITISEDTPLYKIAQTLEKKHIKRVPVVTGGKLVGIVSRSNLLQGFSTMQKDAAAAENTAGVKEVHNNLGVSPTQIGSY